jgi:hypothetical protein
VEEQLTAGLGKWRVAEFVEDNEVLADQIIGNPALPSIERATDHAQSTRANKTLARDNHRGDHHPRRDTDSPF